MRRLLSSYALKPVSRLTVGMGTTLVLRHATSMADLVAALKEMDAGSVKIDIAPVRDPDVVLPEEQPGENEEHISDHDMNSHDMQSIESSYSERKTIGQAELSETAVKSTNNEQLIKALNTYVRTKREPPTVCIVLTEIAERMQHPKTGIIRDYGLKSEGQIEPLGFTSPSDLLTLLWAFRDFKLAVAPTYNSLMISKLAAGLHVRLFAGCSECSAVESVQILHSLSQSGVLYDTDIVATLIDNLEQGVDELEMDTIGDFFNAMTHLGEFSKESRAGPFEPLQFSSVEAVLRRMGALLDSLNQERRAKGDSFIVPSSLRGDNFRFLLRHLIGTSAQQDAFAVKLLPFITLFLPSARWVSIETILHFLAGQPTGAETVMTALEKRVLELLEQGTAPDDIDMKLRLLGLLRLYGSNLQHAAASMVHHLNETITVEAVTTWSHPEHLVGWLPRHADVADLQPYHWVLITGFLHSRVLKKYHKQREHVRKMVAGSVATCTSRHFFSKQGELHPQAILRLRNGDVVREFKAPAGVDGCIAAALKHRHPDFMKRFSHAVKLPPKGEPSQAQLDAQVESLRARMRDETRTTHLRKMVPAKHRRLKPS